MLSAGPIRTDPRPTPTTSATASRREDDDRATTPGRPRIRPAQAEPIRARRGHRAARTCRPAVTAPAEAEMSGQIAEASARRPIGEPRTRAG